MFGDDDSVGIASGEHDAAAEYVKNPYGTFLGCLVAVLTGLRRG